MPPSPPTVTAEPIEKPAATRLVLADGRDPEVVRFEVAVISYFLDAADLLGVPKSLAAIYGISFASPEPLSAAEIKQRLDISTGSVSQGIRFLTGIGALADVSKPGDRFSTYMPDIELRKLILHYLERRVEAQLDTGRKRIGEVKLAIPKQNADAEKLLAQRVEVLEGWHSKSRALLPIMKAAIRF